MGKSRNLISVLATKGNVAVKSSGETVWTEWGANVSPGEPVVYDPTTNETLGVADLATANKIKIGVGVLERRNGKSRMTIRHVGGDRFDLKRDTITTTATPPACACSQVIDIFPTCMKCDETYGIGIDLDDYLVRSTRDTNDTFRYEFSASLGCDGCDTCDAEADPVKWLSLIRDKINGVSNNELSDRALPRRQNIDEDYQPFRASLLYSNTFTYSLPFSNGDCQDCQYLDGIEGALIDGTTHVFQGTVDPSDNSRSLPYQMATLEDQLNDKLKDIGGSAFITTSDQPCCAYKLEVNTCDASFELHDHTGSPITPDGGGATDPLTQITNPADYESCTDGSTTFTPTEGLRILVRPVDWQAFGDALIDTNAPIPNTWVRRITVEPSGDAWDLSGWNTREACPAERIEGHGLYWQDVEVRQTHVGGVGKNYRQSSHNIGYNNVPDAFSKVRNSIVDSLQSYCVYNIDAEMVNAIPTINSRHVLNTNLTYFLVPENDTTTQTSVELFFNKLNELGYNTNFATCLGIVDDTQDVTTSVEDTFDVSTNDTVNTSECDAVTYSIASYTNVTDTPSISGAGVITYTVPADGDYSITYKVFCDGKLIGSGTLTGTATAA